MPPPLTFGVEYEFAFATVPPVPVGFTAPLSQGTEGLPYPMRCDRIAHGNFSYIQQQAYDEIIKALDTAGLTTDLTTLPSSSSYQKRKQNPLASRPRCV